MANTISDSELIVLLNESLQPIGTAPKLASHHADTPLHLAFSSYVFNNEGKVLVTQRAHSKKVWPGMWTNSCCGHPAPDELMEAALHRRLKYELSIQVDSVQLRLPDFRYRIEYSGIVENEYCPVYTARALGEPRPNPDEVADYVWMTWDELLTAVQADPDKYSEWCRLQIPLLSPFVH